MIKGSFTDTIVAPATIPGTGAISIIRISGPECLKIVDAVVSLKEGTISEAAAYTIHFGRILDDENLLDEVLVSVFRAPHSYTGEDSVEISTHASSYIVQEAIRLLLAAGARLAGPGEFTQRAFLNGKMDLAQAEAVADVISATTSASHRVAMNQLKGSYSKELLDLRGELLDMASLLELELDFSEEDVEFADREKLLSLLEATQNHIDKLVSSFRLGNLIKNGVPVAIVGPANAGKSTLLNALVGEDRAIVTDIPGTTRDTLEECITLGGVLFRFIDTAGLRQSEDTVEKLGIARSYKAVTDAEIVLLVLDVTENDQLLCDQISAIASLLDFSFQKFFILLNKVDFEAEMSVNKNVTNVNKFVLRSDIEANVIEMSAKEQKGLFELKNALSEAEKDLISSASTTFVTNARHLEALQNASSALAACRTSLTRGIPSDLVAEDLRRSLAAINSILGKDLLDPEAILHTVFSRHCIGK